MAVMRRAVACGLVVVAGLLGAAADAHAYVYSAGGSDGHEAVFRIPTAGGTPEPLHAGAGLEGVALLDGWVYYSWLDETDPAHPVGHIGRVKTDGQDDTPLYHQLASGLSVGNDLVVSGSRIYYEASSRTSSDGHLTTHVWIGELQPGGGTAADQAIDLGGAVDDNNPEIRVFSLGTDPSGNVYWAWGCGIGRAANGGATNASFIGGTTGCADRPDFYEGITGIGSHLYIARYVNSQASSVEQTDASGTVQTAQFLSSVPGSSVDLTNDLGELWIASPGRQYAAFDPTTAATLAVGGPAYGPHGSVGADPDPTGTGSPQTATSVACTPNPAVQGVATTCTVTVTEGPTPPPAGTPSPSGTVVFQSSKAGAFDPGQCTLAPTGAGTSQCSVTYTPADGATANLYATYSGDGTLQGSQGTTTVSIGAGPVPSPDPSPSPAPAPSSTPSPLPSPPPTPTPAPKPTLKRASVSDETASVPVSCAGPAACPVTLTLSTASGAKAHAARAVLLGTTKATVAAGRHRTVKVKLNAVGRKLLRKRHTLKVTLKATTAGRTIAKATLTFKAKRRKRR